MHVSGQWPEHPFRGLKQSEELRDAMKDMQPTEQLAQIRAGMSKFFSHSDPSNPFRRADGGAPDVIVLKPDHPTKFHNGKQTIGATIKWIDEASSQMSPSSPPTASTPCRRQRQQFAGGGDAAALSWMLPWLRLVVAPEAEDARGLCLHIQEAVNQTLYEQGALQRLPQDKTAQDQCHMLMRVVRALLIRILSTETALSLLPERVRVLRLLLRPRVDGTSFMPGSVSELISLVLEHLCDNCWTLEDLGEIE